MISPRAALRVAAKPAPDQQFVEADALVRGQRRPTLRKVAFSDQQRRSGGGDGFGG